MSMKEREELHDRMCDELDEISREIKNNPNALNMSELEKINKITDIVYKIGKIMSKDGGYSQARNSESRVMYNDDSSNARRGEHYVRGHYSRADSKEHMMEQLHELMEDATTERQRSALHRCMEQLENE